MTLLPELSLEGKVAIVTGGGRGIGASIARSLAKAGADVVVNDLDPETGQRTSALIVSEGRNAIFVQADVGDEASVKALFDAAFQWRRRLDVLVCNAGVTESETIFTISLAHWEKVLRTNLTGAFLCAKYGMQIMKDQGSGGRVIFVGSGVVHQGALLGHVAYAASKGAVHSLSRTLARTGAPLKITANVIAPGITDTELLRATNSDSFIESVSASVPLGIGHPEDIGAAAVFLASEAARHITGITLDVNGGQIIR